jgi:hypothetical protein
MPRGPFGSCNRFPRFILSLLRFVPWTLIYSSDCSSSSSALSVDVDRRFCPMHPLPFQPTDQNLILDSQNSAKHTVLITIYSSPVPASLPLSVSPSQPDVPNTPQLQASRLYHECVIVNDTSSHNFTSRHSISNSKHEDPTGFAKMVRHVPPGSWSM